MTTQSKRLSCAAVNGTLFAFAVLLLWGLRDFVFTPPFLDQWRRVWPKAQAHVLPEAGHWLLEDEPDECVRRVEAFLQP